MNPLTGSGKPMVCESHGVGEAFGVRQPSGAFLVSIVASCRSGMRKPLKERKKRAAAISEAVAHYAERFA